jgi:hypothetical protein
MTTAGFRDLGHVLARSHLNHVGEVAQLSPRQAACQVFALQTLAARRARAGAAAWRPPWAATSGGHSIIVGLNDRQAAGKRGVKAQA